MTTANRSKAFWLSTDPADQVHIPVGGGEFSPSGFIGPLTAAVMWTFGSRTDLAENGVGDEFKSKFTRQKRGEWYWYYFTKQAEAVAAGKVCDDQKFGPQQQWIFQMPTASILNTKDVAKLVEGFGDMITLNCSMATYKAKKTWHEYHLVTLPSLVWAMAKFYGYEVPFWDVGPLVGKGLTQDDESIIQKKVIVTEEFETRMIGSATETPDEKGVAKIMAESYLGQQRTQLWAALDESDPIKYVVNSGNKKFDTLADKLQDCLSVVGDAWQQALWARLAMVVNPKVIQGKDGQKVLSLPVVLDLYANKKEAEKAAAEDKARFEGTNTQAATPAPTGKPALPTAWVDIGEAEWLKVVSDFKGVPKPMLSKKVDPSVLDATLADVVAWLPFA